MTPIKIIAWQGEDGAFHTTRPSLWALSCMQRGHEDYDQADDLAVLHPHLNEEEYQTLIDGPNIDLDWEAIKVTTNGRKPETISAYLGQQEGLKNGGKTYDEAMQLIIQSDCFDAVKVKIIDVFSETESNFFSAVYITDDNEIKVDMPKARVIHMDRIREGRVTVFNGLDRDYMKAHEANDTTELTNIATTKQALRDLPVTFDATLEQCTTPEELADAWPTELT